MRDCSIDTVMTFHYNTTMVLERSATNWFFFYFFIRLTRGAA
jgi:hypothetical protein